MRQYTRIVFGLNALYQTVFGLFCLLAPPLMIGLHGGSDSEQSADMLQVLFRLLGVHLVPLGVISAIITGNPDDNVLLRALLGLQAVLALVCWAIVIGMHNLSAAWIASVLLDSILQVLVVVAVVFYSPGKAPQVASRRRAA